MDHAVYVVFSSTSTGMGRLVRAATHSRYNHVSLSFRADIGTLYSFARYHRAIPLYGGFVEESILRYGPLQGAAQVKICRLPVTQGQLAHLYSYIAWLAQEGEHYLYNTPGAVLSLVHRHVALPKTHTCLSFVSEVLERCQLKGAGCLTISQLERMLKEYVVYIGPPPQTGRDGWGNDPFLRKTTAGYAVYTTVRHFGRLAKRALLGAA